MSPRNAECMEDEFVARIELQPGERFEHIHPGPSTTALVSGEIEMEIHDKRFPLTEVPIAIPARTLHAMRNIGKTVAVANCIYTPPPEAVRP